VQPDVVQTYGPRAASTTSPLDFEAEPIPYVCLPGCGFTGSTLLGFLLNAHPDCASIGAATGLIPGIDLSAYPCSCGARFEECGFWRRVAARTAELGYPVNPFRTNRWSTDFAPTRNRYADAVLVRSLRVSILNALRDATLGKLPRVRGSLLETASRNWAFARAVLEATGKRVFVDTARDHQRPKFLARHPRLRVYGLHLVRDARANVASILKHGNTHDITRAAAIWKRTNEQADDIRAHLPPERWLRIRYDELCHDLQGTLNRIAEFLGIPGAPVPSDFRAMEHHIIGNAMRLSGMGAVREDVSWKERLGERELAAIDRVAGETNRRFGFE